MAQPMNQVASGVGGGAMSVAAQSMNYLSGNKSETDAKGTSDIVQSNKDASSKPEVAQSNKILGAVDKQGTGLLEGFVKGMTTPINPKRATFEAQVKGLELNVIKGLMNVIKKDKPALIVEINKDHKKISSLLKKLNYTHFYYSIASEKFSKKIDENCTNKYFLQIRNKHKFYDYL